MADLNRIAKAFESFAKECHASSPIYERISLEIAEDQELLGLAAHASPKQPVPNLLFAAVRFLISGSRAADDHRPLDEAGRRFSEFESINAFRSFCLTHSDEIRSILRTRRVQTNEVGRCCFLFPAFAAAAAVVGGQPLALIEIGTSAGLLLNWDRYAYRYGNGRVLGDPYSTVQLECELRGLASPPLPSTMPVVSSRLGIDLHVIDIRDESETLWLSSLVWPEHVDRARRLSAAIELQRQHSVRLLAGDGLVLLPGALADVTPDSIPCVFHTAVLNQFSRENRERFVQVLTDLGTKRDLVWISAEAGSGSIVQLELRIWKAATLQHQLLACAHPHGRWLEWIQ